MTIDYSIFYRTKFESLDDLVKDKSYDLFISSYNDSERVCKTFDSLNANSKHWLILPEYGYTEDEKPKEDGNTRVFDFKSGMDESEIIRDYFGKFPFDHTQSICIDTTGFIRPHLIFLVRYLHLLKVEKVDFIYTDPVSYVKKEDTTFANDYMEVMPVKGCEGFHNPDTNTDLLIIGSGFDDKRIADVSKKKANARKIQLFGFPSLQPDMFQQNVIKAYRAEEASSTGGEDSFIDIQTSMFAPANDPFITAQTIKDFYEKEKKKKHITNLYLSPLSTKAQTLGFALYYSFECEGEPISIIFPYCTSYSRETTRGISKIWKYEVEFPTKWES